MRRSISAPDICEDVRANLCREHRYEHTDACVRARVCGSPQGARRSSHVVTRTHAQRITQSRLFACAGSGRPLARSRKSSTSKFIKSLDVKLRQVCEQRTRRRARDQFYGQAIKLVAEFYARPLQATEAKAAAAAAAAMWAITCGCDDKTTETAKDSQRQREDNRDEHIKRIAHCPLIRVFLLSSRRPSFASAHTRVLRKSASQRTQYRRCDMAAFVIVVLVVI